MTKYITIEVKKVRKAMTQVIYKDRAFFFSTHLKAEALEGRFLKHGCPKEAARGLAERVAAVAGQKHTEPQAVLYFYYDEAGKQNCQRARVCTAEMAVRE